MRTIWNVPMIALGEFDAIVGPKDLYVTEYYEYQELDTFALQMLQLFVVQGDVLLSDHAISGTLRPECKGKMKELVARVLASNESNEETVVMLDPDVGGISGMAFCLGDILARGESRRFCVLVVHPQCDELIRRWSILSCFLKVLLEDWVNITEKRLTSEYCAFPDLEKRREEARKHPMRSLMSLLAGDNESEIDAFRRTHNFFECVLSAVFGATPLVPSGSLCESSVMNVVRQYLEVNLSTAKVVNVNLNHPRDGEKYLKLKGGSVISLDKQRSLKPLSVWLLQFMQSSVTGFYETGLLLSALLKGKQVVIYGKDSDRCGNLAFSLAHIFPRSLRSVVVYSEKYILPCECRILSFCYPVSLSSLVELMKTACEKYLISGVVCVKVECTDSIGSVKSYDELSKCSYVSGNTLPSKVMLYRSRTVKQFMDLLNLKTSVSITTSFCKMVQIRIEQLIAECILRGRVYVDLYRKHHSLTTQNDVLRSDKSITPYWSPHGAFNRIINFFHGDLRAKSNRSTIISCDSGNAPPSRGNTAFRRSLVSFGLGLWVASDHDHDILIFLGSA